MNFSTKTVRKTTKIFISMRYVFFVSIGGIFYRTLLCVDKHGLFYEHNQFRIRKQNNKNTREGKKKNRNKLAKNCFEMIFLTAIDFHLVVVVVFRLVFPVAYVL